MVRTKETPRRGIKYLQAGNRSIMISDDAAHLLISESSSSSRSSCSREIELIDLATSPMPDSEFNNEEELIDVVNVSSSARSSQSSSQKSSQGTIIMTEQEINDALFWMAEKSYYNRVLFNKVPPEYLEQNWKLSFDETEHVLNTIEGLRYGIEVLFVCARPYAVCNLLDPFQFDPDPNNHKKFFRHPNTRFTFLPIVYADINWLVIVDWHEENWAVIDVKNKLKDSPDVVDALGRVLINDCKEMRGFTGGTINITSWFHTIYPRMHLVFASWYILRLFRYSLKLPATIMYTENDFRRFALTTLRKLQRQFQTPILDPKQFDGSNLTRQRAVVATDTCSYCKSRGFANLGRHIAMAHGGQAKLAVTARIIKHGQNRRR